MLPFYSADGSLCCAEALQLNVVLLPKFSIVAFAFIVIFKKLLSCNFCNYCHVKSYNFSNMFSSTYFTSLGLIFKSLLYFELIFCVWYKRRTQLCSFVCGYSVFPQLYWSFFYSYFILGILVEDQLTIYMGLFLDNQFHFIVLHIFFYARTISF